MLFEMMYGTREPYEYFTCGKCACLQIKDIPDDLSRHYPQNYYSYTPSGHRKNRPHMLSRLKFDYIFFRKGLPGRFLAGLKPEAYGQFRCFQKVPLHHQSRILDVGCGSGRDLIKMQELGFTHLKGIDPYIPEAIDYGQGLTIDKKTLHEVEGQWDIIKFNHVFEHLDNPAEILKEVKRLLAYGGTCIIRIPVVPCHAFDAYGIHWVQLDAPRHLYLHSVESMSELARVAELNLDIEQIYYDSTSDQFLGSELYQKGIPLITATGNLKHYFSRRKLQQFKSQARQLNLCRRGDQAVFYLSKALAEPGCDAEKLRSEAVL